MISDGDLMTACHICGSSPTPVSASSATETRHYCGTEHRDQDLASLSRGHGTGVYRPETATGAPRPQVRPALPDLTDATQSTPPPVQSTPQASRSSPEPKQEKQRMARELRVSMIIPIPEEIFAQADALAKAKPVINDLVKAAEALGGTVSHEIVTPRGPKKATAATTLAASPAQDEIAV